MEGETKKIVRLDLSRIPFKHNCNQSIIRGNFFDEVVL